MISANFYPTQSSQVSGQIELTDSFNNIQDYNGALAYWLGYINRDNVPQFRKLTDFEKNYDTSTGILVSASFNPIDTENLDFTYGAWGFVNAGRCFSDPQGQIISMYSSFTPWRYINKCKVGLVRMRTPNFRFMLMVRTSSDGQTWGAPQTITVSSEFEDNDDNDNGFEAFYEFVKGERSLTKTFEFSNISIDITINANDLNENYYIPVNGESNGVFYDGILFIYRAWFEPTWNLSTPFDDSTASVTNGCIHTVGVTDLFDNDGNVYYTGSDWYQMARNEANGPDFFYLHRDTGGNGDIYPTSFGPQYAGAPIMTYDNLHYIGGYDFEIGFNNSVWGNANHIIYTNGNIACINQYDNQLFCYTMIRPVDIRYNATLVARYEAGWLPEYDEDNCPTGEFFRDSEVEEKGRPWQIDELTDNDYTEEDRPPYGPEPGPGGDEDEGTIPLNTPGALGATNTFVTRYVLNTTQIRTIGNRLWSTLGDGNELTWQNFYLTISGSDRIDYSLTLSEIISYFVSLKYFPFNLNSASSSTGENGIRIGTGKSLIDAGSTTKTLNDSIVQLDGGRCTIPEKWKNYLDLEPYTTASLYVPYCGTMELPMSVIAGETIGITYLVDMTTGAMTAAVMKYSGSGAYFPIAVMNGSCGFDILMTGTNGNSQMTNAITNLASKSTQWVGQILQSGLTGLMGGISGGDTSGMGALSSMANTVMGIGQDMVQQNIQMPKLYATAPMTSGSSSSLSSLILPQTAYIQIRRHNPYRSSGSSSYQDELGLIGYRSAYQGLISSANGMGFVKCQNPNLAEVADAGATEAEINMIKSLLSDGIFT